MSPKAYFVVHGTVQGVGYRSFVRRVAIANDICGTVRNSPNGTVEIMVEGQEAKLLRFESQIDIDIPNGPSVMQIEKYTEGQEGFPKHVASHRRFLIIGEE